MRLIDADKLMENKFKNDISYNAFRNLVKRQPSIDAVKHGRWLQKPNIFGVAYCSECDYELHTDDTNYCPACGAKMETGAET